MSYFNIEKQIEFMREINYQYDNLMDSITAVKEALDHDAIDGTSFYDDAAEALDTLEGYEMAFDNLKYEYDLNEINQDEFIEGAKKIAAKAEPLAKQYNYNTAEEYGFELAYDEEHKFIEMMWNIRTSKFI